MEPTSAHDRAPDDTDDAFHAAAAGLFRDWLAQHKARLAEEEEVSVLQAVDICVTGCRQIAPFFIRHFLTSPAGSWTLPPKSMDGCTSC
jgi:hypothetical protein